MTPTNPTARRLTLVLAFGAALLAAAGPVQAQFSLPSIGQQVDTPVGALDLGADQDGADACADLATPALPAVPYVPLPVPVPALPTAYANGQACAQAGLDGIHANVATDAMGLRTGTEADLDTSEQHESAKGFAQTVKDFAYSLVDGIRSLF